MIFFGGRWGGFGVLGFFLNAAQSNSLAQFGFFYFALYVYYWFWKSLFLSAYFGGLTHVLKMSRRPLVEN